MRTASIHTAIQRILGLDREVLPEEIPHRTLLAWRTRAERSRNRKVLDDDHGRDSLWAVLTQQPVFGRRDILIS
jgi:hypothetical protein